MRKHILFPGNLLPAKHLLLAENLLLMMGLTGMTLPLAACNEQDTAAIEQTFGPSPTLSTPENSLIPTVNVAKAIGWPAGGKPIAANGMAVNAFATGLDHPRTALCAAQWRRAGGRDQRAAEARR